MTSARTRCLNHLLLGRLVAWCLLVALPIYGLSATITAWLGPAHVHTAAATDADPMVGWQDFRRVDHVADSTLRVHVHAGLARHHHAAGDTSVMALGGDDHDDGPSDAAAAAAMPLTFIAVESAWPGLHAAPASPVSWGVLRIAPIRSAEARRLDRPPSA